MRRSRLLTRSYHRTHRYTRCALHERPQRRPFTGERDPFRDLKLEKLQLQVKVCKDCLPDGRQHVNPLSIQHQTKSEALVWDDVFDDPEMPLIVDAGTGYGRFPLLAALKDEQKFNYLGIEIRERLVTRANLWAEELDLSGRVHFAFCNITISLESLLKGYPGEVQGLYIQFPDPLFKKKRLKRHIVQPEFVHASANILTSGGLVFTQSDVPLCAIYMRQMFEMHGAEHFYPSTLHSFANEEDTETEKRLKWDRLSWLRKNPIGFPSEREISSLKKRRFVYRMLLVRK